MPCIHGLDESNCPTCSIMRSSLPQSKSKIFQQNLKPESAYLKQNGMEKEQFINDLVPNNFGLRPNSINQIPKPKLIAELPNFENKALSDRLKEISVTKSDVFGISKKVALKSPEFIVDERK